MKEFPLIISKRLLKVLSLIDHDIARELINLNCSKKFLVTQTFIDIDPTNSSSITFIQPNKASTLLNIDDDSDVSLYLKEIKKLDINHRVYTSYRSSTRFGRFIINTFGDKYNISDKGTQSGTDIETFVNMYKAAVSRNVLFDLMDVVNGEKIPYFYNYQRYNNTNGSLGNSCMKSANKNYFDIYAKNPETCSLVIMYTNSTKRTIKGRALLWKLSVPEDRYFMDRIYVNDYSHQQVFIDFAKYNNWLYKSDQSIGNSIPVYDPLKSGSPVRMDLMAITTKIKHEHYPYFDTMAYYGFHNGTLANNEKFGAEVVLQSTGGGISQNIETVYSKYHNSSIRRSTARYCIIGEDYVNKDVAVRVYNYGPEGKKSEKTYAIPNHESIVKMELRFKEDNPDSDKKSTVSKYFPKEKCTWSEYLNTWVFTDSTVLVWTSIKKTEQVLEYIKRLDYSFVEIDGEYFVKEITKKTPKKSTKRIIDIEQRLKDRY